MEDDDSNSNSSSNKSALDLRSLASAVRIKRAQEVGRVEKRQKVVIKRNDDSRGIWEQVKDFASRLVDELVKRSGVPMEIEALVRQRYNCKNNSEWLEDAISEFEDSDLKGLMPLYHGKKKDSIASTCAFLVKLTNMPEEKNGNPAFILQHFGLWDNSDWGLSTSIPTELLDRSIQSRSVEEERDFKIGVNLFVAGVVIYSLVQFDSINRADVVSQRKRSESKVRRSSDKKLAIIADRLEEVLSASKGMITPKADVVRKKVSRKTATAQNVEFKGPRTSNIGSLLNQVALEDKKGDIDALHNMLASQSTLIESLLAENKKLQASLVEENRKLQELVAGSKKVQGSSGAAEDKSAAFARLAAVKLANKGNKPNSIFDDDDDDDEVDSDFDGMSGLSSGGSYVKSSVKKQEPEMSELEKSARLSIFGATRVTTSIAPILFSRLVTRLSHDNGIYVCDCQGNVFRMIQDAKTKSTKAYDHQFSLSLEFPLWASKQEIETDETCLLTQRWPQNWIQLRMYLDEQLRILERDSEEEHKRVRALKYYDTLERYRAVKQFVVTVKDIVKATLGLREEPTHSKHIQVFALISHFVYLMWTSAMVNSQTSILTEDPSNGYLDSSLRYQDVISPREDRLPYEDGSGMVRLWMQRKVQEEWNVSRVLSLLQ